MPITYGFILIIILICLIEILSVALKVTGLDLQKARFQVISIITQTGFTTRESELITQHPVRRKIAQILMIISYVGTATLISMIVNALRNQEAFMYLIFYTAIILLIVIFLIRNRYLLFKIESLIEKSLMKRMEINYSYKTAKELLKLNDEYGVAEVVIGENCQLIGKSLENSGLKQNYIQVLNIDRGSYIIHFPKSDLIFKEGDKVLVYGQTEKIKEFILRQK